MKNYTKVSNKFIEDIQSNVTIYQHNQTKARICTIENEDNNKVFSTPQVPSGKIAEPRAM